MSRYQEVIPLFGCALRFMAPQLSRGTVLIIYISLLIVRSSICGGNDDRNVSLHVFSQSAHVEIVSVMSNQMIFFFQLFFFSFSLNDETNLFV